MFFLPSSSYPYSEHKKIMTYLTLAHAGCPVLRSVVMEQGEYLTESTIQEIKEFIGSDECTLRYQYTLPNNDPIRGGNKYNISLMLNEFMRHDAILWLMEPVNRLTNRYGINMRFDFNNCQCILEIVGKGFDVSDINRGSIIPHQTIIFPLPMKIDDSIRYINDAESNIVTQNIYEESKEIRLGTMKNSGMPCDSSIFSKKYIPLSYGLLEQIIGFIDKLSAIVPGESVVSCSIMDDYKFVFWDIQTSQDKISLYTEVYQQ